MSLPSVVRPGPAGIVTLLSLVMVGCQLDKLLNDPGTPPPVNLSVTSVRDSAAFGSTADITVALQLSNPGTFAIAWQATTAGQNDWLVLDAVQGTAPSQITATLSPHALEMGMYRDTIFVARTDLPEVVAAVPVQFQIQPCRVIHPGWGSTVIDELSEMDCSAPHREEHFAKVYRVTGQPDDSVTVTLSSSEFDVHLIFATAPESDIQPLLETSTCVAAPGIACAGNFSLAEAQTFYIEVTSQQPLAAGAFTLTIDGPHAPEGPGGLEQFADQQGTPIPQGGTVPENELFIRGVVNDADILDSVRLEIEIRELDAVFSDTPTHIGNLVRRGDTVLMHVNGLLDDTGYQWQARTVDVTGRLSDWVPFGPTDPDFHVQIQDEPAPPSSLGQFRSDGVTPIPPAGAVQDLAVVLAATVQDNDPDQMVRLEIEVRAATTAFSGVPTASSVLVPSGSSASILVANLTDRTNYHWQARGVDQSGLIGAWTTFGSTHGGAFDFGVNINANQLFVAQQPTTGFVNRPLTPITVQARKPTGEIDTQFTGQITASILPGSGNPSGSLSGTVSVTAVQGAAIFSNLIIDQAGENYRLTFQTAGLPAALSEPIAIRNVTPTQLVIITQPPERAQSGTVFTHQPVVELRGEDGTPVAVAGTNITVSLASGPLAVLTGTKTLPTNNQGRVEFKDLGLTGLGGTYTLVFTEANGRVPKIESNPIVLSGIFDIDPNRSSAEVPLGYTGLQTNIIVSTRDADGVTVPVSPEQLTITTATGSANPGTTFTITPNADSTYTVSYAPQVRGTDMIDIRVDDVPIAGSPYPAAVSGVNLSVVSQPSPLVQEGKLFPEQPVLAIIDDSGNSINRGSVSVSVSLAAGEPELRGTTLITTDTNGIASYSDLLIKGTAGFRTLRFAVLQTGPTQIESIPIEAVKGNPDRPGLGGDETTTSPTSTANGSP